MSPCVHDSDVSTLHFGVHKPMKMPVVPISTCAQISSAVHCGDGFWLKSQKATQTSTLSLNPTQSKPATHSATAFDVGVHRSFRPGAGGASASMHVPSGNVAVNGEGTHDDVCP